jgi:hypothetical protein
MAILKIIPGAAGDMLGHGVRMDSAEWISDNDADAAEKAGDRLAYITIAKMALAAAKDAYERADSAVTFAERVGFWEMWRPRNARAALEAVKGALESLEKVDSGDDNEESRAFALASVVISAKAEVDHLLDDGCRIKFLPSK